jgi:cation diffusion facilitator family transporter
VGLGVGVTWLLVGGKKATKAPDADHPFGFGRERYFWAFVVSIILFTLGSLFAIYEGIHKIQHPEPLESPAWAIGTLLVALVLEGNSFRTAIHESRPLKGSSNWLQFIRRSKNPELPVVLLEDFGALIGLVLALGAISLNVVTHDARWDGIGSLVIGLLLGVIAITLSIEMKSLLIGEAADPQEEAKIVAAIAADPLVRDLIFLRTQHFGPDQLLVTAKVEFDPTLSMTGLATAIDEVELAIRAAVPTAHYLFIEPDVRRAVANADEPDDPSAAADTAPGPTDAALDD